MPRLISPAAAKQARQTDHQQHRARWLGHGPAGEAAAAGERLAKVVLPDVVVAGRDLAGGHVRVFIHEVEPSPQIVAPQVVVADVDLVVAVVVAEQGGQRHSAQSPGCRRRHRRGRPK